jgi:hypothetical protein
VQRVRIAGVACLVAIVGACSKSKGDASMLAAQDLQVTGAPFDPNEILDPASMQDEQALDSSVVQQFLQRTPYGHGSFLATYASHGLSAADALVQAARQYAINPLVVLVHAEMEQGLVAAQVYPQPASRVEYAFGCGCAAPGDCDPAYGGFDVQVECLAAALRASLDQIAASGATAGNWGPGKTSTTQDGQQVTPADASTAALYQYTPFLAVHQPEGNWLFWNIWQSYAGALGYAGPAGGAMVPGAWIGDACSGDGTCVYAGMRGTCATQFPQGLCTLKCTQACPTAANQAQTFCADFGQQGGFCLDVCNPNVPECRTGYTCQNVKQFGSTTVTQSVCFPK